MSAVELRDILNGFWEGSAIMGAYTSRWFDWKLFFEFSDNQGTGKVFGLGVVSLDSTDVNCVLQGVVQWPKVFVTVVSCLCSLHSFPQNLAAGLKFLYR